MESSSRSKRAWLPTEPVCSDLSNHYKPGCTCPFHAEPDTEIDPAEMPSTQHRVRKRSLMGAGDTIGLVRIDTLSASNEVSAAPGEITLLRFLDLIDFISYKTPYSSSHFNVNQGVLRKLIVNHLPLIVGHEIAKTYSRRLVSIITHKQEKAGSLIWVTNRQQGKTTTVAKFIAALLLASPIGGNLIFIYSTSLDRAQEVLRSAKQYIYYIITSDRPKWCPKYEIHRDNERMISIFNGASAINTCVARPKRVSNTLKWR